MICSDNAQGLGLFIFQQQRIATVSSLLLSVFVSLTTVALLSGSQGFFTRANVGAVLAAAMPCECLKHLVCTGQDTDNKYVRGLFPSSPVQWKTCGFEVSGLQRIGK
jgi:hypothetical protein